MIDALIISFDHSKYHENLMPLKAYRDARYGTWCNDSLNAMACYARHQGEDTISTYMDRAARCINELLDYIDTLERSN